ncbi:hypothetical protein J2W17_005817 [Pseudomonas lini]|nr:hypothetical protein [Pseudomonas lini]
MSTLTTQLNTRTLFEVVGNKVPPEHLAGHFHDNCRIERKELIYGCCYSRKISDV